MQVIVLGMHRSGTSTVGRILNMMGMYYSGEGNILLPANDNQKGFYERRDVRDLNDDILAKANAAWWDVENLSLPGISDEDLKQFKTRANRIICKLDSNRPWFMKDPRHCLLADFWHQFLELPMYMVVTRNPQAVANSLERRNGFDKKYSLALWEKYHHEIFSFINRHDIHPIFIDYDQLLANPKDILVKAFEKLDDHCQHTLRMPSDTELEAFLDLSLNHTKEIKTDLLNPDQLGLYEALKNERIFEPGKNISYPNKPVIQNDEKPPSLKTRVKNKLTRLLS